MTVYIDVIFIENMIMNLSIILSEAIILNLQAGFFRKFLASIIGTIVYIFQLLFHVTYVQLITSILIVWIAFKPSKIKVFLKEWVVFYFITFLFGGISFAFMNLKNGGVLKVVRRCIDRKFRFDFCF